MLGCLFTFVRWMLALLLFPAAVWAAPVCIFEAHADIGKPKLAGHATWSAASQEHIVTAGGVNMWGVREEFHTA